MNTLSTNPNPHLGYYQVGETIHYSKVSALIDGTKRNIHPEWIFNNDSINAYDWSKEPVESIQELYLRRAQQLREKYDYLVLLYSGGSDSQNILDVFLKNNIKIDEIVTMWMHETLSYTPDANNFDSTNILSEWDLVVKPQLQKLAVSNPEIKITVHNWAKDITKSRVPDDYLMNRNSVVSPFVGKRFRIEDNDALKRILDREKNAGLIVGIDKPRLTIQDNKYKFYFLDVLVHSCGPHQFAEDFKRNLHTELFYWSPDSFDIIAKQCHMLADFFDAYTPFQAYLQWPTPNPMHRQFFESVSRGIIYPDMDLNFFQSKKGVNFNFGYDRPFVKYEFGEHLMTQFQNGMNHLKTVIDKKYFIWTTTTQTDGQPSMINFINGMWTIRPINRPKTINNNLELFAT